MTSQQSVVVPAGELQVLFAARGSAAAASIEIVSPGGVVYSSTAAAGTLPPGFGKVAAYSNAMRTVFAVDGAAAGTWTVRTQSGTSAEFAAFIASAEPTVAVVTPSTAVTGGGVVPVSYAAFDPDSAAAVSLFYRAAAGRRASPRAYPSSTAHRAIHGTPPPSPPAPMSSSPRSKTA